MTLDMALLFGLIAIVALLIAFSLNVSEPYRTFLRLMSCPACIFLGSFVMTLSDAVQVKYIGIIAIVVGVFILIETAREFMMDRKK